MSDGARFILQRQGVRGTTEAAWSASQQSLAPFADTRKLRSCQPMPASFSMIAKDAGQCCVRSPAIVACSALMVPCPARPSRQHAGKAAVRTAAGKNNFTAKHIHFAALSINWRGHTDPLAYLSRSLKRKSSRPNRPKAGNAGPPQAAL